ncbi:MAG: hypothetical protein J6Y14_05920 [Fibrobacter sp.]|nr:hypothetical protein [Fibrobacter sp.]
MQIPVDSKLLELFCSSLEELFSEEEDFASLEELSSGEDDGASLEELSSDEDGLALLEELSSDEDDLALLEELSSDEDDLASLEELSSDEDGLASFEELSSDEDDLALLEELLFSCNNEEENSSGLTLEELSFIDEGMLTSSIGSMGLLFELSSLHETKTKRKKKANIFFIVSSLKISG